MKHNWCLPSNRVTKQILWRLSYVEIRLHEEYDFWTIYNKSFNLLATGGNNLKAHENICREDVLIVGYK